MTSRQLMTVWSSFQLNSRLVGSSDVSCIHVHWDLPSHGDVKMWLQAVAILTEYLSAVKASKRPRDQTHLGIYVEYLKQLQEEYNLLVSCGRVNWVVLRTLKCCTRRGSPILASLQQCCFGLDNTGTKLGISLLD